VLLALVCALVPVHAIAALRGVWIPSRMVPVQHRPANGCEQPSLRNANVGANGGHAQVERWFSFSTRSTVVEVKPFVRSGSAATPLRSASRSSTSWTPVVRCSSIPPRWSPTRIRRGARTAGTRVRPDGWPATQSAIYVQEYLTGTTRSPRARRSAGPCSSSREALASSIAALTGIRTARRSATRRTPPVLRPTSGTSASTCRR